MKLPTFKVYLDDKALKRDIRLNKLVALTWVDATSSNVWQRVPTNKNDEFCIRVLSVGILVRVTPKEITLCGSFTTAGFISDVLVIPRSWVVNVRGVSNPYCQKPRAAKPKPKKYRKKEKQK